LIFKIKFGQIYQIIKVKLELIFVIMTHYHR